MNMLCPVHQMAGKKSWNKHTGYVRRGGLLLKQTRYQKWPFNHGLNFCLLELGYELRGIWNMDEPDLFFKALLKKCLVEKLRRYKGDKKSK